jgi:hypothetical protein
MVTVAANLLAVIVPVPLSVRDAPEPTIIAATVLVPEVIALNAVVAEPLDAAVIKPCALTVMLVLVNEPMFAFTAGKSATTKDRKVGANAPPDAGPANTVFAVCVFNANVKAGVVVGVATDVVNNGLRFPEEKDVTVPVPPVIAVADTLLPVTLNVTVALLTKFTLGMTVPFMRTEEPAPTAASMSTKFSATIGSIPIKDKNRFGVIGSELCT